MMQSDLLLGMTSAASGMNAQSTRLRVISENVANADTPGYRRKLVSFAALTTGTEQRAAVEAARITLDQSQLERIYDPSHPLADGEGYFDGTNVEMVIEIADAREAQRSYEANLRMFDQSRNMIGALFDLLRR